MGTDKYIVVEKFEYDSKRGKHIAVLSVPGEDTLTGVLTNAMKLGVYPQVYKSIDWTVKEK